MPLVLFFSFLFYTLLSWVLLFRDDWSLEVLATKFYPGQAALIDQIHSFLNPFKLNTVPTFLFVVFVLAAFGAYFVALKKTFPVKKVLVLSVIFQIIVFFSYPILSKDIFYYIFSDRVSTIYHQNVWQVKSSEFPNDPYYYLVYPIYKATDWYSNQTKIYGPINQAIYSVVTALSGDDFLVNLAAHKFVVFIFNLAMLWLVYKILKDHFPDKLPFALVFVFWNPLFLLETVGAGHNDTLMIFFILLSYEFFLRRRPFLTAAALTLAAGVKSTALFLVPIYTLVFLGRQFMQMAKFLLTFAGSYPVLFSTMGIDFWAMVSRITYSTTAYWQSLPQQLEKIHPVLVRLLTPLFLLYFGVQNLRGLIFRQVDPLVLYGQICLIYLLFALGAYWNWYSLWVLTAFVFLGRGRWSKIAAAFTFTSALAYPLYWFSLRFNFQHPLWPVIIYLVILAGPVVTYLYDKTR